MDIDPRPLTPPLADAACLSAWLALAGIPVGDYGTGEAKSVAHLLGELRAGESRLAASGVELRRLVEGSAVVVLARSPEGRRVVLVEDHQRFSDGRIRRRSLGNSVGEKLTPGEEPLEGAVRALREELALGTVEGLRAFGVERSWAVSTSYPGLVTENTIHRFVFELDPADWRPEGYRERQADKETVFVWEPVLAESSLRVVLAGRSLWFSGRAEAEDEQDLRGYCGSCGQASPWPGACVLAGGQAGCAGATG